MIWASKRFPKNNFLPTPNLKLILGEYSFKLLEKIFLSDIFLFVELLGGHASLHNKNETFTVVLVSSH